ncbi:hypothetical protein LZ30DRAFT_805795 [Colletotrichum cereale]|nr:hypothetical protein LZ30DRAFT_805795 [Colletotrichum cereale]
MSAGAFRARVESGQTLADCHDRMLRIAFIYLDEVLWDDKGVFGVVNELHTRGWSFGQGNLKFNRYESQQGATWGTNWLTDDRGTLDIFYVSQIGAGIYRSSDNGESDFRQYYSPGLLTHPTSARFYRLPDLQDLPDSSDPLGQPRKKGHGLANKLPRWAHNVVRTHRRQPTLPVETMAQIALDILQQTISQLRKNHPAVQPFSETKARFWLKHMKMGSPVSPPKEAWNPDDFGIHVAQGSVDTWAWAAHYSPDRWEAVDAPPLEPDLDGTHKSEVNWCGWPDGGLGEQARNRGWEPEVGSDEEIAFLAAVAVEETEGVDVSNLDYAMRSHILLGVLYAAASEADKDQQVEQLRRRVVDTGRLDETRAEQWMRQAQVVMEPYLHLQDI